MSFLKHVIYCFIFVSAAALADGNTFKLKTNAFGLEVTKPATWLFATADQHKQNLENIKLNDEEFRQMMIKNARTPLVMIMKYPEPFDDLNPSLKIQATPISQMKGVEPKQFMKIIADQMKTVIKDMVVVQQPIDTRVGGMKATYMRINYSLQTSGGRAFLTASEMWIVPKGNYFFTIGAGIRQDEKTGSFKEIQKILETLKIQ